MKKGDACADFELDLRLARGLKKRHVSERSKSCLLEKHVNSCSKFMGKEEAFQDPEYEMFCNSLEQCEYFDEDDDVDLSLEYGDDDGGGGGDGDDLDPEYEMFMRNLIEDGKSYVLQLPENGALIKYEEEDGDFRDFENNGTTKDCKTGDSGRTERSLGSASEELEIMSETERPCSPASHSPCNLEDENYLQFLKYVEINGENLAFMPRAGQRRIFYEDDESSDPEVIEVDPFCDGCYTPFVPSKGYVTLPAEESYEDIKTPSRSLFREKLMDILKEPFSQSEYDDLWENFDIKRPVEGIRMLRNGRETTYTIKSRGKSYHDDFRELSDQIALERRNRNAHKILNLLRGFFYWLKNIAQEDSFKPWLDSSFLKACNDSCASIKRRSQVSKTVKQEKR